jgi:hypothetical protein
MSICGSDQLGKRCGACELNLKNFELELVEERR